MTARIATLVALVVLFGGAGCVDLTHNDRLDEAATRELLARPLRSPPPLDVAIVLGCPSDDETGEVSPCQRCRVDSALAVVRRGLVRHVIFSGGAAHNRFVEADTMARLAVEQGMPPEAIEREGAALTTWMNLRYSRRIMRRRGWTSALVITTAAHLLRAHRFARALEVPVDAMRACDWPGAATPGPAAIRP